MKMKLPLNLPGLTILAFLAVSSLQAQQAFSPGLLKLEVYRDIEGTSVDDLRADPKYPDSPDEVHFVTRFEIPSSKYVAGNSGGIKVGQKLSGYIVPSQTANYVFYMSANENGELWLSQNANDPSSIELIASGAQNYPARTYDVNTPSTPIRLESGKRYYVEALMKEGGKEDSMAVAWTKENDPAPVFGADPIPGSVLGILTDKDTTAPSAITNLTVDAGAVGNSYLWLNWTAPGDAGNTGTVAHYDLRYSTSAITSANWSNATPAETAFYFPSPAGTNETFKVEKLNPNTVYYFAVRAMDMAGNFSALSNVAQQQTKALAAGDYAVLWDLEFDKAGEDPTAKGDWKHRTANQTSFDASAQVADGVLKAHSFNPILDSAPKDNFTEDFIVDLRMRCVTPVADNTVYDGVVFWVNLDTVDQQQARVAVALQLMADNTQQLNLVNKDAVVTTFKGLSADFQKIRLEFKPALKQVVVMLNDEDKGSFTYERQETSDSRFASILSWNADGEFDYARIGRPLRQMDARWDLSFDQAGVDPTIKGDWKHRTPGQTAFVPDTQVADGVLSCLSFNPILDTTPKDNFNYPFVIEARLRCVEALPDNTKMYDGACFFINMDSLDGQIAKCAFSMQLLPDGTQQLNIMNSDSIITNYTGLSTDFHTVRWEVDPTNMQFQVFIDGSDAGTVAYQRANTSDDRYATILGWGYASEFDFARIGTPVAAIEPGAPQLKITRAATGVVISWPASATGFVLESTTSLSPAAWSSVSAAPTVNGDQNIVTTGVSRDSMYFRLKK